MATKEIGDAKLQDDSEVCFQNGQALSSKTKIQNNLESQELFLASLLRENDEDLERDSDVLQHMGAVYHLKGLVTKDPTDFVKASALFNSSMIRTKDKTKNETLQNLILTNENMFLQNVVNIKSTTLPVTFRTPMQEKIDTIRVDIEKRLEQLWRHTKVNFSTRAAKELRIKEETSLVKKVKSLSRYTSIRMKLFFKDTLSECYNILGLAPQKFAVVGLGSLAREEMTPYSDLEFIILIEDDDRDKQYFRNLTHLFHLFVINLGETPLPALGIKSLNDFNKKNGDWFYDSISINGICFDGAMPWACKTPTGRIELIKSPENMIKHVQHEYALKEGYHLAEILRTITLIDGRSKLSDKFSKLCSSIGNDVDIKHYALNRLREDAKQFGKSSLLDILIKTDGRSHLSEFSVLQHVKKAIYRLPSILTNNLKLIQNLRKDSPWDLLDEMKGHLFSDEDSRNLQVAVSIAVLLRLKTYVNNKGQKENLSFLNQSSKFNSLEQNVIKAYFCDNEQLIFRYYFTVVPLVSILISTHWATRNIDYLSRLLKNLYDDNYILRGHLHSLFLSHRDAIECYRTALNVESRLSPEQKGHLQDDISYAYYELCEYDNALHSSKQSVRLWSVIPGAAIGMANALNDIGMIQYQKGEFDNALIFLNRSLYLARSTDDKSKCSQRNIAASLVGVGTVHGELGNNDEALSYHFQALGIVKEIYGNESHTTIASSLESIGTEYMCIGNYHDALVYQQEALQMKKRVFGASDHPDVAVSLNNIALLYKELHDYEKSLSYQQEALQMSKRIRGTIDHPDVAKSLNNIASLYQYFHDYGKSLSYHQEALQIKKRIHGTSDHPDVVRSLNNIASLYNELHDYDNSLSCHQEALQMLKRIHGTNYHPDFAITLNNIASLYRELHDYENSLSYHQEALQMRKRIHGTSDHPDVANSLNNVALLYTKLHDYDNSLLYYQEALQMNKRFHGASDHTDAAAVLNNVALLYKELHDHDEAVSYHQEALQMLKRIHGTTDNPDIALINAIALTYYELEDYDNAMIYQHQKVQMEKQVSSYQPLALALSLLFLSKLYKLIGEVGSMIKYKQEAADIIEPINPEWYAKALAYWGLSDDDDKVTHVTSVNDKPNDDDSPTK